MILPQKSVEIPACGLYTGRDFFYTAPTSWHRQYFPHGSALFLPGAPHRKVSPWRCSPDGKCRRSDGRIFPPQSGLPAGKYPNRPHRRIKKDDVSPSGTSSFCIFRLLLRLTSCRRRHGSADGSSSSPRGCRSWLPWTSAGCCPDIRRWSCAGRRRGLRPCRSSRGTCSAHR